MYREISPQLQLRSKEPVEMTLKTKSIIGILTMILKGILKKPAQIDPDTIFISSLSMLLQQRIRGGSHKVMLHACQRASVEREYLRKRFNLKTS